jgi:hypothetical protein
MRKLYPLALAAMLASSGLQAHTTLPLMVNNVVLKANPDVRNFQGLAVQGPIQVFVKFGNIESLRLEGDEEVLASLVTEVRGNVLVIRPKPSVTSWAKKYENKKIVAYVTVKTLNSLTMSGNGTIEVSGTINAAELTTTLSGSGRVNASVDVDKLTTVLSGSGHLDVKGKAERADITMSGASRFAGKNLKVDVLNTRMSGAGHVEIHADETIDALISGSAQVNYTGNASVKKRVIGSGGVNKI